MLFLISPAAEQLNAHRRRLIVVPALPSLGISSPTSSPSALPTITAKVPNSPKKESQEQQPIGSASKVARAMSQPEPGGDDGGKQPAEKPAAAETAAAADGPVRGTGAGKEKSGAASDAQPQQQQPPVKQKTPSGNLDPRPGGSASSAAPTDDAESQATTTNVDESGDSESGGHNEPGKMFVGGLSWQTSAEGLRDYFCKFGEVNECMVMRDPTTKRARGFGFITFADPTAVEKVLALEAHELDGKRIDPKIAFPKKQQPKMVIKTKKVFIGGLSSSSTLEDIKTYFTQYGRIEDAMLMFDKSTQRHRGFGFITFDDDDVSDKVCEIHFHEINGKMVECKKAQPKEVMLPLQLNKTRAAAARNLYGLAPEQLLAYASYIPRPPAYGPVPSHHHQHHHHGMMATAAYSTAVTAASELPPGLDFLRIGAVPSAVPFSPGNGYPHPHSVPAGSTHHPSYGGGRSGHQQQMGNNNGGLHARDLAAAQLVAQQQAVYEALVYANQLSSLAASASADFSTGPAAFGHAHHHQQQHHGHHSHPPMHHHHQQQQQTSGAQQYMPTAVVTAAPTALHSAAGPAAQQQQPAPPQQFSKP